MQDVVELFKQAHFTIVLDENVQALEATLEEHGFKVWALQTVDVDVFKRKARGWTILTRSPLQFVDDAVRYDYDVIGIDEVASDAVGKISEAVRRSQLATRKGNFWLRVRDNGSFHLQQLV